MVFQVKEWIPVSSTGMTGLYRPGTHRDEPLKQFNNKTLPTLSISDYEYDYRFAGKVTSDQ